MNFVRFSTALAASTLLSSAVFAQESFTHVSTIDATGTQRLSPSQPYSTVQVTITDVSVFSIRRDLQTVVNGCCGDEHYGTLVYFHTGSAPFPGNATSTSALSGIDGYAGQSTLFQGSTTNGPSGLSNGQYTILFMPDHLDTFSEVFTITKTFTGAVLGWGPSINEQFAQLVGAAGALSRRSSASSFAVARSSAEESFVARGRALSYELAPAEDGTPQVVAVSSRSPDLVGNVYTWFEFTGYEASGRSDSRDYSGRGLQLGADIALSPNWIVGVSLGAADLNASANGFAQDGTFRFIQPYASYRNGSWSADISLVYGQSDYDQVDAGGAGSAESDTVAVSVALARDIAFGDRTLTPSITVLTGQEEITGTGGTLAAAGTEDIDYTEISLGARYSFPTAFGGAYLGLYGDHLSTDATTALASGSFDEEGWSGRVELGADFDLSDRSRLAAGVAVGGLGSDLRTMSGNLRFEMRF